MLEEYKNKQVKMFLNIGQENIVRTGQIIDCNDVLFKFRDKFGKEETFSISSIQQIKEVDV